MDAAESLADLKQISTQIDRAVIVRADGSVAGSTVADDALSSQHRGGRRAALGRRRPGAQGPGPARSSRSSRWPPARAASSPCATRSS